jgi:hypothetical protein
MTNTKRLLLAIAILPWTACGSASSTNSDHNGDFAEQLQGHWVSARCETYPDGMGGMLALTHDVNFRSPDFWTLAVTFHQDTECASPSLRVDAGSGPFEVGMPSAQAAGAVEVDYTSRYRKLTPLSAGATAMLNQSGCGDGHWMQGMQEDISAKGCPALGLPSIPDCPTEHDLNKIVGRDLYFGDRAGNLCASRPTKLGPYPATRQ